VISVFFPYYQCGDKERQKEIDLCLTKNAENALIDNLFVVIDDGCDCPVESNNIRVININTRLTYKKWLEMTAQYCTSGITVLCNSDIYFDESLQCIHEVLKEEKSFIALSRWELLGDSTSKHPNPHWSQDTWAMNVGEELSPTFMHQLDFPMGVPRCDNKIAYLFAVQGWKVFNPVDFLKSIHAHESEMRTYHKKLDDRILGGAAYVYPGTALDEEAKLDFDVWTKRTSQINKVAINKSMEKWIKEAEAQERSEATAQKAALPALAKANYSELLGAVQNKSVLKNYNINFEVLEYQDNIFFKNAYQLNEALKITKAEYTAQPKALIVSGLIPPVLINYINHIGTKPKNPEDLNFWQYPCATEKQAYENHLSIKPGEHIDLTSHTVNIYVPLPWATYVDKKAFPETYLARIQALISYYKTIAQDNDFTLKVHSVCQHIHWIRMLEMAQQIGITDFHLSHKDSTSEGKQKEVGTTLTLHGWPLIAVNYVTPDRSEGMERKPMSERKLLASFIGAHMPHYRDDSRIKLFEAAKECGRDDVFVDLGNEWHFNKVVYEEQVLNREVEAHHIDEHHQKTFRYNSILSDSKFSLCPEGAGPNTLRFWESIAVGSIPVIFSDDLAAFTELSFGYELLENVFYWEGEIGPELFIALNNVSEKELAKRSTALVALYSKISKWHSFEVSSVLERGELPVKKSEGSKDLKYINVLYVGASVTAQKNGYRPELNKKLEAAGYTVNQTILATGATGSIFGLCNLSTLQLPENETFDLTVYEYSTGDLNIGLTPLDVMVDVVFESLAFLKTISQQVVLVNNYRSDYENGEGEFVREKHRDAAKLAGVPVIDTYPVFEEMRKNFSEQDWKEIYRDNVHTSPKGSKLVSDYIFENLNLSALDSPFERGGSETLKAGFYFPQIIGKDTEIYTYPSSGQKFKYFRLKPNETISMKLKGEIWGLISVVGPTSGWVNVQANGSSIQEFCQLDAHCYYERIQPRQFMRNFEEEVELTIQLIEKDLDFNKVKQPHKDHNAERELRISCIMGKNLTIQDLQILGNNK